MTGLLVFLVLILVGSFIAITVRRIYAVRRAAVADKVRRDLLAADQRVASEHLRARRAMNDAAGQSWRNLAG